MIGWVPERFVVKRVLGEGGMGIVYAAEDRVRGELVALKVLRASHPESVYRTKREFRALANVEHPNLVRLYDLFAEGDSCCFSMELVDGVDLARHLRAEPDDRALRSALAGLCAGLRALHGVGLLHRDLKPSNVLVTNEGRVVLLDFGLAVDAHAVSQATEHGGVVGTIAYMAPEQTRGESELTTAVDLYALGTILFELVAGELPYRGAALTILSDKQSRPAPSLATVAPGVAPDLARLCAGLLSLDATQRPSLPDALKVLRGDTSSRPSTGHRSSHFVHDVAILGREGPLRELGELLTASHTGTPTVGLVRGRSGVGKSALLSSFARTAARDDGAVVLFGRCYEFETVPYKGLDGVVDSLSRFLAKAQPAELGRLFPPDLGELATLFPVLRRIKPIASAYARRSLAERPAHVVRTLGFECLRELLRRIAETSVLVVVVDDVQWADDDTSRGLVELLRDDHAPGLLLLLGARPDDAAPVVRDLFGDDALDAVRTLERRVIELGPLDGEATRKLVQRELGGDAAPSLVESIAQESAGLPFAGIELARFAHDDEASSVNEPSGTIDALIRRRAGLLDDAPSRVLRALAVAGEPLPVEVVLRAAGVDEGDRAPIDRLRVRHFLRTVRTEETTLVDAAHDRIREAVTEALSEDEQRDLHRRLAIALEATATPRHDKLARHFAAARESALAVHHATAAAEEASAQLAFQRAAELYGLALEHAEGAARTVLLAPYAEALAAANRNEDAARAFREAADAGPEEERRDRKQRAAECLLYAGLIDEGFEALHDVAAELGFQIPRSMFRRVLLLARNRLGLWFRGLAFRAVAPGDVSPRERARVRAIGAVTRTLAMLDPISGAIASSRFLREALDLAELESVTVALGIEGGIRASFPWIGSPQSMVRALERIEASHPSGRASVWIHGIHGLEATFQGYATKGLHRIRLALERLAELSAVSSLPSDAWLASIAHYTLGLACICTLDTTDLRTVVRFAEARQLENGPHAEPSLRAGFTPNLMLRLGKPEAVHEFAGDEAWAHVTRHEVAFRTMARVYALLADAYDAKPAPVLADAGRVLAHLRSNGVWSTLIGRQDWITVVGSAAVLLRDRRAAARAVRALGPSRSLLGQSYRAWAKALAALASDDRGRALRELNVLRRLAVELDNPLLEATACFGIGRLSSDGTSEDARARFVALVEGADIVDPDRYFWMRLPVGEAPARRRATGALWAADP